MKQPFFLFLIAIYAIPSYSQHIVWEKVYDSLRIESYYDLPTVVAKKISTQELAVLGSKWGKWDNASIHIPILIKIDSNGLVTYQRSIDIGKSISATQFVETAEGDLIIVGVRTVRNRKYNIKVTILKNGWIGKINKSGELLWEKEIEGFKNAHLKEIIATKDGNYTIVGEFRDLERERNFFPMQKKENNVGILKIDGNGNILSQDFYGIDSKYSTVTNVVSTEDNQYLVNLSSSNLHSPPFSPKYWQIKLNNNGIFQSYNRLENNSLYSFERIINFHNQSIIIGKKQLDYTKGVYFPFQNDTCFNAGILGVLSSVGSVYQIKKVFCKQSFKDYIETKKNLFIIGHETQKDENHYWLSHYSGVIIKLDEQANILWEKKFPFTNETNKQCYQIIPINENSYWVVGLSGFPQGGNLWVTKLEDP